MPAILYTQADMSNHNGSRNVETVQRAAELAALLRAAVQSTARQLLIALPPAKRSVSESQFLQDCVRDRRAVSGDTLALLLVLQARADRNFLSDALRTVEVQIAPEPLNVEPLELHLAEEDAEAAFDKAQTHAIHDPSCPARAAGIVENGREVMRQVGRVVDYYAKRMHIKPRTV